MSLADEDHRKMVRDIIRQARDPVKNRVVPLNVIEKYTKKVKALEKEAQRVSEEEKAEREIACLENKANRLENSLKGDGEGQGPERTWFKDREVRISLRNRVGFCF